MKFRSRRSPAFGVLFLVVVIIMLSSVVTGWINDARFHIPVMVICGIVSGFFGWLWFQTYYIINEGFLHYRSGPFFGKIAIQRIRKITTNTNMYVGFKPALASNGLIIHHDRWSDIYISPRNSEQFIEALKEVKPEIEVD